MHMARVHGHAEHWSKLGFSIDVHQMCCFCRWYPLKNPITLIWKYIKHTPWFPHGWVGHFMSFPYISTDIYNWHHLGEVEGMISTGQFGGPGVHLADWWVVMQWTHVGAQVIWNGWPSGGNFLILFVQLVETQKSPKFHKILEPNPELNE